MGFFKNARAYRVVEVSEYEMMTAGRNSTERMYAVRELLDSFGFDRELPIQQETNDYNRTFVFRQELPRTHRVEAVLVDSEIPLDAKPASEVNMAQLPTPIGSAFLAGAQGAELDAIAEGFRRGKAQPRYDVDRPPYPEERGRAHPDL